MAFGGRLSVEQSSGWRVWFLVTDGWLPSLSLYGSDDRGGAALGK